MRSRRTKDPQEESVGAWAKRLYFASRVLMNGVLRSYGLGSTQWYVLHRLIKEGPTMQRDFVRLLQIERATLSGIVSTLVRKGLIKQLPDPEDQRQRMLHLTDTGKKLWKKLPDPIALSQSIAFNGVDRRDLATASRVLQAATERLNNHILERK